ncbi:N-acetylglucosamine-6-phosphate deacetylase [Clostridium sp. JN-1]|uniref:N-acetylglucosamine-6-phosphate deacetylase n=1 Tax=Clostridium sp. JN-1 TaxID=2483110 RepID=UPI000F0B99FA|nr:N-acetylglucosamine-6-phosphate deacetylase [Clostridium sp. JN-1]
MRAIVNGKIITKSTLLEDKVILFDDKIEKILDKREFHKLINENTNDSIQIADAQGMYVSPGFIDIHIHGAGGSDTMDGTLEALEVISKTIAKSGVTAFLPTTMTMSKEKIYKALDNIKEAVSKDFKGAKVLGAHVEGPFINEKYKGAQKEDYILNPSYDFIKGYEDDIKIITLAPEKDENLSFIKTVKEKTDIALSIGHSDASYEQAMTAIENGITQSTHIFNRMTPLNHRKPGIVGAAFNSDIFCELIADTIHVHPAVINILVNIKGKEKVILITDSMRAGGMKDGISELGGQKVIVKDGSARLEDGTLAGSVLTLNKAVKNVFNNTSLNICEAVDMASLNPAKSINIDGKKGSIEIGKDADIVIFDENFDVKHTIVSGKTVFKC